MKLVTLLKSYLYYSLKKYLKMTELENNEVIDSDETIDETTDNQEQDYEDETTDNQEQDYEDEEEEQEDEITWEQAQEWKRKAERAEKAERRLVELKKQLKEKKTYVDKAINSKDEVKRILAEERFYEKNPEAESYRDKIESYQNKWLSLEDSFLLATKNDKQIDENREVYGKSIVRWNWSTEWINLVTVDQYDNMTESEVNKYNKICKSKYGAIKFK